MIIIILLTTLVAMQLTKVKLLTSDKDSVVNILITINPLSNSQLISIQDREEQNKIYELISQVQNVNVIRFPRHYESVQIDYNFYIKIIYKDGKYDYFKGLSNHKIYRFLRTKGSSGDAGYISGTNKELWKYLYELGAS